MVCRACEKSDTINSQVHLLGGTELFRKDVEVEVEVEVGLLPVRGLSILKADSCDATAPRPATLTWLKLRVSLIHTLTINNKRT